MHPPTLTKADLADTLSEQIGLTKRESRQVVEAFFDLISQRLTEAEDVKLSGFGHFATRQKTPRPGRNPRTGELVPIEARRVVTFHVSQQLRDKVQGDTQGDTQGNA